MRLTERQRKIATYYQLQADTPLRIAAEELELRPHTVRRELQRLIHTGILTPYPCIDLFRLGFFEHDIYFSLGFQSKKRVDELLLELAAQSGVSWIYEVGGRFQVALTVVAHSARDVQQVLRPISDRFPGVFVNREHSICFSWTLYQRRYLSKSSGGVKTISIGGAEAGESIDQTDRLLLRALSHGRVQNQSQLARLARVPESTVSYHLARLRERKIFRGFIYALQSDRIGVASYRLFVKMRDYGQKGRALVKRFSDTCPYVVSFCEHLGAIDFSLRIETGDSESVFSIGQELREALGELAEAIEVIPVFRDRKLALFPFTS